MIDYPDPPEEEVSDEFDLFKPIIDAFVAKYPEVENGPEHIIFGDYNLERHWLQGAKNRMEFFGREGEGENTFSRDEVRKLLGALIDICDLLGVE